MKLLRGGAEWLVRLEIILLALVYASFVATDAVPLWAFAIIALVWFARWQLTGRATYTTPLDLPILLLVIWLPVSFSVSIAPWASLPKIVGVVLSVLFYYAVVNALATPRDLAWAVLWLVMVCAGIALAGLVGTDWAQGKIISVSSIYDHLPRFIQGIPRSIAGGFARNGVGGTLTLTIPLLAALAVTKNSLDAAGRWQTQKGIFRRALAFVRAQSKWIALASLVLSLLTLALTQSRGGILGTAIGLVALAIWRERRFAWLLVVGALGLVVALMLGYGAALLDFVLRMDAQSGTLASRLEVWQRGLMMMQDFSITGIGIGTYNSIAHLLYPFFIASPAEVVAHAHNQFLQVAVDLGIPGLIAYIALLTGGVLVARRAYRSTGDMTVRALLVGLTCGLFAHHVFGLTDAFILGTKPGVVMWIYFALVAAMDRMSSGVA